MSNLTYENVQGTYHIAGATGQLYEPSRNSTFDFICTDLAGILDPSNNSAAIANADEVLRISVMTSTVPNFKITPVEIRRGNSVIKAAGLPSFEAGSIKLQDYIGAKTKSIIEAWQALAYNVRLDRVGYMSDYKKDCTLVEYDVGFRQIRSWTLKGCWISGITEGDYDKSNNELRQITATLEYDRAIPEIANNL